MCLLLTILTLGSGCETTSNSAKNKEELEPQRLAERALPGWGSIVADARLSAPPAPSTLERKEATEALRRGFDFSLREYLKRVEPKSSKVNAAIQEGFRAGYRSVRGFEDLYRDMPAAETAWDAAQDPDAPTSLATRPIWLQAFDEGAYEACLVLEEMVYGEYKAGIRLRRQSLDRSGLNLRFHEKLFLAQLMRLRYADFYLFERDKATATWVAYFPNGSETNGLSSRFYEALYRRNVRVNPEGRAYYGGPLGPRPRIFVGVRDQTVIRRLAEAETGRAIRIVSLERLTFEGQKLAGFAFEIRGDGYSFWQPINLTAKPKETVGEAPKVAAAN